MTERCGSMWETRTRRGIVATARSAASPLPIRCTSLFQPAKRTPTGISWRG